MFRKLNQESGMVLLTVLIVSIGMIIIGISILSLNINQVKMGQLEIERIRSAEIAKGKYWSDYSLFANAGTAPVASTTSTSITDNYPYPPVTRIYPITTINKGANSGPNSTTAFDINVGNY